MGTDERATLICMYHQQFIVRGWLDFVTLSLLLMENSLLFSETSCESSGLALSLEPTSRC